jgi:hypothetical protein
MDYIICLINEYPHLVVCFFLSTLFAISQLNYGWKAYHYRSEKYCKQYRTVNIITCIIFFTAIIMTGFKLLK